jgi:hypothetical protein
MSIEGFGSREGQPDMREQVRAALKRGVESVEARELLNSWLNTEQERVERGEITNLAFNISWAELYRDAGLSEYARESFEQCAEQAYQEGNEEQLAYCEEQIAALGL